MKPSRIMLPFLASLIFFFFLSPQLQAEQGTPETTDLTPFIANSFVDIVPSISPPPGHNWYGRNYYEEGWYEWDYDDSLWEHATTQDYLEPYYQYYFSTPCVYYSVQDTTVSYIRGHVYWDQGFEQGNRVKKVYVKVCANQDFTLYLNGTFVGSESDGLIGPLRTYDVTSLWQTGSMENIFATEISNSEVRGSMYILVRVYFSES